MTMKSRTFAVLLTLVLSVGLCLYNLPVTYCNDPLDPNVRERVREEWRNELLEHQRQVAEREIDKSRWNWDVEKHAALLREWEQERAQHELELKERTRREEEERARLNLFWGRVEAHQCKTYGTREYTAVLVNAPTEWRSSQLVEACRATPLEIHGIRLTPKSCQLTV